MLQIAAIITIPCTKIFARMVRNKRFNREIHDIYKEYKEIHGKGMKAPFILNPPAKVYNTMDFNELYGKNIENSGGYGRKCCRTYCFFGKVRKYKKLASLLSYIGKATSSFERLTS